ncbi:MAG: DUF4131 domain-containing protein, partial [Cyanobium sp.]
MAAIAPALLLVALGLGVLPLPLPLQAAGLGCLVLTSLITLRPGRCSRLPRPVLPLLLLLAWLWGLRGQPHPGAADPARMIPAGGTSRSDVGLVGRLLSDPQAGEPQGSCRVLLQQGGGRTELLFQRCPTLQQGWRVEVRGTLKRPRRAPHPLLSGPAERLERQGCWSQLRPQHWRVLQRPFTPVADLRRRMA